MRGQAADGSWQKYQYNAASRLVKVTTDANGYQAEYIYGGNNQRLVEITNAVTTFYAWDGGQVVAEYWPDSSGTSLQWKKSYVYLGGRLLTTEASGNDFQLHHPDRLGTRLVTNRASGAVVSEQIGLPFGTEIPGTLPNGSESYGTNQSNRRFTSYDRSSVTKLDYAVNRYYDAGLGRFTQVDPIGMSAASLSDPQTLNLYAYCGNDPINHLDPDGLFFGWLKKLFKGILKVLANKWVQLALGIALAVIGFINPQLFIHHAASLTFNSSTLGFTATAASTTITGAGWAVIGLASAQTVGAVSNIVQEQKAKQGKAVKLSGKLLRAFNLAREKALKLLDDPESDCAKFLKAHGVDPSQVAGKIRNQTPYDGLRSTNIDDFGVLSGKVSKVFRDVKPDAATNNSGTAVYYSRRGLGTTTLIHETLHTIKTGNEGFSDYDWNRQLGGTDDEVRAQGTRAVSKKLEEGGCK